MLMDTCLNFFLNSYWLRPTK